MFLSEEINITSDKCPTINIIGQQLFSLRWVHKHIPYIPAEIKLLLLFQHYYRSKTSIVLLEVPPRDQLHYDLDIVLDTECFSEKATKTSDFAHSREKSQPFIKSRLWLQPKCYCSAFWRKQLPGDNNRPPQSWLAGWIDPWLTTHCFVIQWRIQDFPGRGGGGSVTTPETGR